MDGCYPLVPALLLVLAAGSCGGHTGFYVDTATHTVLVAEATRRQQQQLAGELLALLGLPAAPRRLPATPAAVPSHMVALYRRHAARQHAAETEEDANLVISFPQKPAAGRHDVAAATLTFDVRRRLPPPPRGELRRLVLRMRRRPPAAAAALTARLSVTLAAAARDMEQHSEPVIVTLDAALTGWVDFNLTDAITSSLSTQIHAVHIRLSITDASGVAVPFELSGLVLAGAGVDDAPALVAYVWTPPPAPAAAGRGSRRPRRAAAATASVSPRYTYQPQQHGEYGALLANSERQQPCQRRALHVNFADLKWQDWLIAPPHFSAFYCVGQCAFPLNAYMNASNHAIIQTLVHMFQVNIPKPGCAPTRLSPLSVLFIDEHSNVLLRDYQNMVVRACGCQ